MIGVVSAAILPKIANGSPIIPNKKTCNSGLTTIEDLHDLDLIKTDPLAIKGLDKIDDIYKTFDGHITRSYKTEDGDLVSITTSGELTARNGYSSFNLSFLDTPEKCLCQRMFVETDCDSKAVKFKTVWIWHPLGFEYI